jgi:cobalt-zinc-cadmium efflux system membrane fusion protein
MRHSFALPLAVTILTVLAGAASTGCRDSSAAMNPPVPQGEAWLTLDQMRARKISVEPVAEHELDDSIVTSGRVAFDDLKVSHVFSPVTGRVVRIQAGLGQHVHKGDVLAVIQSPDLSSATSDVGKAEADLVAAKHDYERKKELYEARAVPLTDFEVAEDAWRRARAERERAVQRRRALTQTAGTEVSDGFALVAPIDGDVVTRSLNPGVEVQGQYAGGTSPELFTIGELDRVWVLADIYEVDVARVKLGAKVSVKSVAYPSRTFEGTVDWISGAMDPATRTARIRCTLENPDHLLKPEMYATVRVATEQRRTLAIPRSSVLRLGDQTVVFVQQTGRAPDGRYRFERLPVAVEDAEDGPWVRVTHGLGLGVPVVADGVAEISALL